MRDQIEQVTGLMFIDYNAKVLRTLAVYPSDSCRGLPGTPMIELPSI
jgi:hypothetical protein